MTFEQRLAEIRAGCRGAKLDLLVALHDGAHFIEKPDPVMVLTGVQIAGAGRGMSDAGKAPSHSL